MRVHGWPQVACPLSGAIMLQMRHSHPVSNPMACRAIIAGLQCRQHYASTLIAVPFKCEA